MIRKRILPNPMSEAMITRNFQSYPPLDSTERGILLNVVFAREVELNADLNWSVTLTVPPRFGISSGKETETLVYVSVDPSKGEKGMDSKAFPSYSTFHSIPQGMRLEPTKLNRYVVDVELIRVNDTFKMEGMK